MVAQLNLNLEKVRSEWAQPRDGSAYLNTGSCGRNTVESEYSHQLLPRLRLSLVKGSYATKGTPFTIALTMYHAIGSSYYCPNPLLLSLRISDNLPIHLCRLCILLVAFPDRIQP
jgi:hypothetical protein